MRTWAFVLAGSMLLTDTMTGCKAIREKTNKTQRGAIIGAGAGAVAGGLIGRKSGNTAIGAILGATVGGAGGALIGRRMDKQAEELRRGLENARVERVGEGIKITFASDFLFDVDQADLKSGNNENIAKLAETLKKYNDTEVLIEGHADNTGSDEHNQKLSERRAKTVAKLIQSQGIKGNRLIEKGYGESQPIADNSTVSGRQQNRRVEVAIYANDKLRKAAERGTIGNINT
ncbi:outer membrane protein OmpA-like peptidoglycan-associated protein [Larkinella arboricola]|uniref:Outer membrane protein OmpA-like peptidoglycan-associated protein n=2 Tax=Larkinella arboricola TaxID=643671 RepID=A0A327WWC1_LARAB|nr:outer membrane protein OmpA-like peptidoglycan-associated protein [Larkinella arboricola]